jgi:hypothetical protein
LELQSGQSLEVAQIARYQDGPMALNDPRDFQVIGPETVFAGAKLVESLQGFPIHGQNLNPRQELDSLLQRGIGPKYLVILLGAVSVSSA